MLVQLPPQDVVMEGEMERQEGRQVPPQSGLPGRRAPPGDLLPILQSDSAKQEAITCALPSACTPALQAYWSERRQLGPFLLQNINDSPSSRAGNRHQMAQPTQTAGCQHACPPAHQPPHHLGGGNTSGRLRIPGFACLLAPRSSL
jgi:hypothetical protein